jgi:hypothetical protein
MVIRSPALRRFLFSTRARTDRLVTWSGQIGSSFRSRRRYFGSPGGDAGVRASGPGGVPCGGRRPPRGLATSVLCISGVRCTGVCTSAGGEAAGRAGSGGGAAEAGCNPASEPRFPGLMPASARRRPTLLWLQLGGCLWGPTSPDCRPASVWPPGRRCLRLRSLSIRPEASGRARGTHHRGNLQAKPGRMTVEGARDAFCQRARRAGSYALARPLAQGGGLMPPDELPRHRDTGLGWRRSHAAATGSMSGWVTTLAGHDRRQWNDRPARRARPGHRVI